MEWKTWPSVEFEQRENLPPEPGIYVVVDATDKVWYVGLSTNLCSRWEGRKHHRFRQLNRANKKRLYRIHWQKTPFHELEIKEIEYINEFKPILNFSSVKKYIRTALQPDQELMRLLKVINKKTTLFPDYRSAILGYYNEIKLDDNEEITETLSIIILITVNDSIPLRKSYLKSQNRKGLVLQKSWNENEYFCGKSEPNIKPVGILNFLLDNINYEFVVFPSIPNWLREHSDKLMIFNIFEQEFFALKDPMDFESAVKPSFFYFGSRGILMHEDYILYRMADIKPICELLKN